MLKVRERESWIDIIKLYACILVVLGHFLQSMVASDIIQVNYFTEWFDQTIYYFHVPLFFICSGYVYQKYAKNRSFAQYKNNLLKKLLVLGIPYLVFSTLTWLLKNVFSSAVNSETDGFFRTLFIRPLSPYWYLYALIIIFFVTVPMLSKKEFTVLFCTVFAMKILSFVVISDIYALKVLFQNQIWFVMGMGISIFDFSSNLKKVNVLLPFSAGLMFLVISLMFSFYNIDFEFVSFVMGIIGCLVSIIFALKMEHFPILQRVISKTANYTFPIFLMHTIFAAGMRAVLFKLDIDNIYIHITLGLILSFLGPIIFTNILSKIKWMDFVLYLGKYIKIR